MLSFLVFGSCVSLYLHLDVYPYRYGYVFCHRDGLMNLTCHLHLCFLFVGVCPFSLLFPFLSLSCFKVTYAHSPHMHPQLQIHVCTDDCRHAHRQNTNTYTQHYTPRPKKLRRQCISRHFHMHTRRHMICTDHLHLTHISVQLGKTPRE